MKKLRLDVEAWSVGVPGQSGALNQTPGRESQLTGERKDLLVLRQFISAITAESLPLYDSFIALGTS